MSKIRVQIVGIIVFILGFPSLLPGAAIDAHTRGFRAFLGADPVQSLAFRPPAPHSMDSLGEITLAGSGVVLLSPSIHALSGKLICQSVSGNPNGAMTISYATESQGTVHVTADISVSANTLAITLNADRPLVASADFGQWPDSLGARKIAVPYYDGNIWYAGALHGFVNAWWDFHESHGTLFSGPSVQYRPRTDGTLVPLHEKLKVVASANVDDTFPSPGNPASPYMSLLAGRMVEDIWTPGFQAVREGLEQLGDYGITDCAGIIHDWQHAGYDNGLPQHYPASDKLGGDDALKAAIAAGKADGCLMALHENYIDYYPNYPGFNPAAVAAKDRGQHALAWKNGQGIQAFQTRPSWMVKNASTQSPAIHQIYGTDASFLDVNSAVTPFHMKDLDPAAPFGGSMQAWIKGASDLWAYERKVYGGPVFGEGANHWYYSGLLDGVEAQFGVGGVPLRAGGGVPLFVDFDLLRIHPLQVNHGAGYYERWTASASRSMTTEQFDAYRMQEIIFGHAPFLGTPYWNDIPHALVESNLAGPVAKSYGAQSVRSIRYQVNGAWTTPSAAAQAGAFDRPLVEYVNGLQVAANANPTPLTWDGMVLPPFGWAARGSDLLAYTALCGNMVCDYAQTPASLFANARNQSDMTNYGLFIRPSVASVKPGPGRSFSIIYNWIASRKPPSDYKVFVHFVDDRTGGSGIAFQGDHAFALPSSQWPIGQTISDGPIEVAVPPSVPAGTYSVRIGLIDPVTGARVPLLGENDGTGRYVLGRIAVGPQGEGIRFTPLPQSAPSQPDPRLNAAGKILDFGTIQTDGMVSVRLENNQWVLRPFPRNREFTILISSRILPIPSQVISAGGSSQTIVPRMEQGGWWRISLNGAKTYSWPASHSMPMIFPVP